MGDSDDDYNNHHHQGNGGPSNSSNPSSAGNNSSIKKNRDKFYRERDDSANNNNNSSNNNSYNRNNESRREWNNDRLLRLNCNFFFGFFLNILFYLKEAGVIRGREVVCSHQALATVVAETQAVFSLECHLVTTLKNILIRQVLVILLTTPVHLLISETKKNGTILLFKQILIIKINFVSLIIELIQLPLNALIRANSFFMHALHL